MWHGERWEEVSPTFDQFGECESKKGEKKIKIKESIREVEEKYEEKRRKEKENFPGVPTSEARRSEN